MRHFGGWFRAVATMLASLAMIISTAVTAFAAGAPPFVPASHGRLSELTQASGDWGPALAVILVVAATSTLLLGLRGVRQHSSREGQAAPVTDATA
jgi:type IV secretory pathway VirB2 component (pilin)